MEEKVILTKKTETTQKSTANSSAYESSITKKSYQTEVKETKMKEKQKSYPNIFSAGTFASIQTDSSIDFEADKIKEDSEKQTEVKNSSSTIVTPNFDFMETLSEQQHQQIFKEENVIDQEQSLEKKRKWSFKSIIFAILFAIFGIWGIVNISTIDSLNSQIEVANEIYNVNLANYLKNLTALDTTNQENMENLFEVIPTETLPPTTIGQSSNWFDRFCNFLAGLFGG